MPTPVNNAFYDTLGDRWFEGDGHPIALLRAEAAVKLAYAAEAFARHGIGPGARILDVACGAGLITLPLAAGGFRMEGVDLAEGALEVARRRVPDGADATFRVGDALALDAPDETYDAVLLFDVIEHVEDQRQLITEAARVVRPGGVVLYNTFNRTPLSWLVAVEGFRFVTREREADLHVWRLFVPPTELQGWAEAEGLRVEHVVGIRPSVGGAFWRSVLRRRVDPGFAFTRTRTLAAGYMGTAVRTER